MQIDNRLGPPEATATRSGSAQNDSQRWLAALEREFLQANAPGPQASTAGAQPRSPASSGQPSHAEEGATKPGSGHDDGVAHHGGHPIAHRPSTRLEALCSGGADAIVAAQASTGVPPSARPGPAAANTEDPGSTAVLQGPAPTPTSAAPALALDARRPTCRPGTPGEPADTSTGSPASAPRYARQLLSITDGEHASARIRDASLSPADARNVALDVSLQLHAANFGVRRIYINGQRFDSTPFGVAAQPARPQPLIQDDDA